MAAILKFKMAAVDGVQNSVSFNFINYLFCKKKKKKKKKSKL